MRITGRYQTLNRVPGTAQSRPSDPETASQSRALVALHPVASVSPRSTSQTRPDAAFLAHLIATAQDAPQTRERRRADPSDGVTLYALRMRGAAVATALVRVM